MYTGRKREKESLFCEEDQEREGSQREREKKDKAFNPHLGAMYKGK